MSAIKRAAGIVSSCLNTVLPRRSDGFHILLYHRTSPVYDGAPHPGINVTPAQFREQLIGLQRRGCGFLSLRDVLEHRERNKALPPRTVVVTFDDGYYCNYEYAWPILRELEVPATIFVSTAYLDGVEPFPFDPWGTTYYSHAPAEAYRPLTVEQCRTMMMDGAVEIGAHTHTHGDFRGTPDKLRVDLRTCLDVLKQHFELEHIPFAFPYGRVQLGYAGGALAEVAREVGVTCSLTTECHANALDSDPYHWGRFNVYEWDTAASLDAKLNGWY